MPAYVADLTELTLPAANDFMLVSDTSDPTNRDKKMQLQRVALKTGTPVAGRLASWTDANQIQDGGFLVSDFARKTGTPVAGRVTSWADANQVQDGGFLISDIARLSQPAAFASTLSAAGRAGFNNTDPVGELEVFSNSTSNANRGITSTQSSNGVQGALFGFRKSRGTRGSETAVVDGDFGFVMDAWFHDGSTFVNGARIAARVNGAVSTGVIPADLVFYTGIASLTEGLRLLSTLVLVTGGLTSAGASQIGVRTGTANNDAAVGGVLYKSSATFQNSGTAETTLATYDVPANTLALDNQSLEIEAFFVVTSNANSKSLKLYFGSDNWGVIVLPINTGGGIYVRAILTRTGAATQKMKIYASGTAVGTLVTVQTATRTLTSTNTLRFTGQGGASNDLRQEYLSIKWADANL